MSSTPASEVVLSHCALPAETTHWSVRTRRARICSRDEAPLDSSGPRGGGNSRQGAVSRELSHGDVSEPGPLEHERGMSSRVYGYCRCAIEARRLRSPTAIARREEMRSPEVRPESGQRRPFDRLGLLPRPRWRWGIHLHLLGCSFSCLCSRPASSRRHLNKTSTDSEDRAAAPEGGAHHRQHTGAEDLPTPGRSDLVEVVTKAVAACMDDVGRLLQEHLAEVPIARSEDCALSLSLSEGLT